MGTSFAQLSAVAGRWCFRPSADTPLLSRGWLTIGLDVAFGDGFAGWQ